MDFVDLYIITRNLCQKKIKEYRDNIENEYEDDFFNLLFNQLKDKVIYVDSNIFMAEDNKAVDRFFNEFSKYEDLKIKMPSEQYEELYNLKSKKDSKAVREAFRRLEKLVDTKHIEIINLDKETGNSSAYADPVLIDMITNDLKEDRKVYFVTEDKDLKIRLKVKIEDDALDENNLIICSFETLYNDKYTIVDAERERKEELKKKEERIKKMFDEIENGTFKSRMGQRLADFITR